MKTRSRLLVWSFLIIAAALVLVLGGCPSPAGPGPASYTVTFKDPSDVVLATRTVTPPATTVDVLPGFTAPAGRTYGGWRTAPNGGGIQFTTSTPVASDLTVYEYWTPWP